MCLTFAPEVQSLHGSLVLLQLLDGSDFVFVFGRIDDQECGDHNYEQVVKPEQNLLQ